MNTETCIRFRNINVDLLQLRVTVGEKPVHFTLSEMRLLLAFLSEPYRVIPREELIQRADLTSIGYLHNTICRLRLLLGQQYIFTRNRMGYSFIQPICRNYSRKETKEGQYENTTI